MKQTLEKWCFGDLRSTVCLIENTHTCASSRDSVTSCGEDVCLAALVLSVGVPSGLKLPSFNPASWLAKVFFPPSVPVKEQAGPVLIGIVAQYREFIMLIRSI